MKEDPASFIELLQEKILPNVQRIALLIAVTGLVFLVLHYPGADQLLLIGFASLAIAYFLLAIIPLHSLAGRELDKLSTVIYKLIYLGCSVTTIGILFHFLKLNGTGEILLIGSSTCGVALVLSGLLIVKSKDNWMVLKDAIIRGTTLFLLSIYMMRQASII